MEMPPPLSYLHMIRGCIFFPELLVIHNDLLSNVCAAPWAAVYSPMIHGGIWGNRSRSVPGYRDSGHDVPSAGSPGSEDKVRLLGKRGGTCPKWESLVKWVTD